MKNLISFLAVLFLMPAIFTANAQEYIRGDVNDDGQVNISDVTCLIEYLLKGAWPVDGNHEYVDLGLNSGTLWATCNVGAIRPEEYGDFFAWGETTPREEYTYENYKWWYFDESGYRNISKYNTKSNFGPVDNKTELEPEDDAAYVNWGTLWRMPSLEQVVELVNSCSWQWTQKNGVIGHLLTGPNGNTMFLPAAGNRQKQHHHDDGMGCYLSRILNSDLPRYSCGLYLGPAGWTWGYGTRYYGQTVRAVRIPKN